MDVQDSDPFEHDHAPGPAAVPEQQQRGKTLTMGQSGPYPQLILFGDSILQQASMTFQPRLQTLYTRRADIVNRGLSGYTTELALASLPYVLPASCPNVASTEPSIRLAIIFFGANDAALPGNAQHIPLERYIANLKRIIEYSVFKQHGTKIVLVAPAPVNEWQLMKPLNRTANNAKIYAQAVRELAKELQIPCVDLWSIFMCKAGYYTYEKREQDQDQDRIGLSSSDDEVLKHSADINSDNKGLNTAPTAEATIQTAPSQVPYDALPGSLAAAPNKTLAHLLHDGLHFSPVAYDILFDALIEVLQAHLPDCLPENLPMCFRDWKDILGVAPLGTAPAAAAAAREVAKPPTLHPP